MLNKLTSGMYLVSTKLGDVDNGCITNTITQVNANMVSVTLNKSNYTTKLIKESKVLVASILSIDTPMDFIKIFGFTSGISVNKFNEVDYFIASNQVLVPDNYVVSYLELTVEKEVDLDTHVMFICKVNDEVMVEDGEVLTYERYHEVTKVSNLNKSSGSKTFVCSICGYTVEADSVSEVCPICNASANCFIENK